MSTQRFSVLLETQPDGPQQDAVEATYGHTGMWCDEVAGIGLVQVDRSAPGLGAAIVQAITEIESTGLTPVGVAQDDEARPVVATAACLALELRALPLSAADRAAIYHLIHA